jgi:hypothetical protein
MENPLIGTNKMLLNHETVRKALQYWLNEEVLQGSAEVKTVRQDHGLDMFEIEMTEVPD